ncbi:MAG: mannose-1-phosphate guanylyltransferase/mannose-6-phosphate isomerase [Gammaproteobacteria bacterium]|nr:mannose-1-phosphate guanylyltransferase/mannose-6-phosphate isomerase [Gammaproteobacteria bacterium]
MIVPVILAGGVGSRLWPQSRALLPKQFIDFPQQGGSLFQNTLSRLAGLDDIAGPVVLCNNDHRFLVAQQLSELGQTDAGIMLEPVGRNTAPAVAVAALEIEAINPDAVLLVLPADHVILDVQALQSTIGKGKLLAESGKLVTFGIVPSVPETGYGYKKRGKPIDNSSGFAVEKFVEKPDLDTARSYLASGEYLWNSGMFMFKASTYLSELANHAPAIEKSCRMAFDAIERDKDYVHIPLQLFEECPGDSIDYAIMEKTDRAAVIPLDAKWNDLGAWSALWEVIEKDDRNNVVSGDVLLQGVSDSYVQAESRLVAVVGISDVVVVETSDAVLVAAKDKVQDVKKIVEKLQSEKRPESQHHDLVYRPWGSYQSLVNANGYQVKHIVVKPGAALSLQMHHKRAEHWTVVHGEAKVTRDDEILILKTNESVFLPLGCKHRLENTGSEVVEIIEVQVGDYLGEDDIVRFEDVYGRIDR